MNENVQKSNDLSRALNKKELKDKGSRANELDSAELSPDLNSMGEDLMGSMDPDMFGRSSNAFRRAWEEEPEENPRQEEEGEGQGEPEDGRRQEGDLSPSGEEQEQEDEEGQPEEAHTAPEPESLERPEPDYQAEAPEQPAVVVDPDVLERSQVALESTDTVEQPEAVSPAADSEETSRSESSFTSLLDVGSGFLRSDVSSDTAELEVELLEETLPELSPGLASLTSRLIIGDASRPAYRRLEHYLARFGLGVLRSAVNEKVKVVLLPPGESLATHPLVQSLFQDEPVEGAVYLPEKHTLVIEESCVNRVPRGFNQVIYYFAHAFDHILGDEGYASVKSAAVMASYQSCQQKLAGHRFADELAGISPMHYFAQAVESYLSEDDCLDPLWTRDDLYDFDRSMYDYVDYLFHRTNKV